MTNAEVILETVRWVEGRLGEELTVPLIAARAGYSTHHFARLFAGVVGLPPGEYVSKRRLSEAARAMAMGRRATDAAFEFGFRDLETFSRAFKREFGATPSSVRRGAGFRYYAPALGPVGGRTTSLESAVERLPRTLLAGKAIVLRDDRGAVGRLWAAFSALARSAPGLAVPLRFRQLAWEEDAGGLGIMAAAEARSLDELPIDFMAKVVPACECLVFVHRGPISQVGESYQAIYSDLLPSLERRPFLPFNLEDYFDDAPDPRSPDYRMRILVPFAMAGGGI